MKPRIPDETIAIIARSMFREASRYGFERRDHIRLVNAIMDHCIHPETSQSEGAKARSAPELQLASRTPLSLPISGPRVTIREVNFADDHAVLERWIAGVDGLEFLNSTASAQKGDLRSLAADPRNHIAMVTLLDGTPIGSVAFLDHDARHRRAELRKLIGESPARGKGYAREATLLWIQFGFSTLGLEKIYLCTTATNLRNIKLNEQLGFVVEGLLRNEIFFEGGRHDILRMALLRAS